MPTATDSTGNELFTADNPATLTIAEGGTGVKRKTSGTTLTTADGFELFSAENPAYVQLVGGGGTGSGGDATAREVYAGVVGSPLTKDDSVEQQRIKTQAIKKKLADNLTAKGVTSTETETLDALASKVPTISSVRSYKGTVTTSNTSSSFRNAQDSANIGTTLFIATITNLGFIPSLLVLSFCPSPNSTTSPIATTTFRTAQTGQAYNLDKSMIMVNYTNTADSSPTSYGISSKYSPIVIEANRLVLPVQYGGVKYYFEAIE